MDRFRDKYRIPSARLQNWNYGWNASYFVTINTGGMAHHFGKIVQGKMHLSAIGQLAEKFWLEIPEHFPFVLLGVHQIMPNHMHGIITIYKTKINSHTAENENNGNTINGKDGNNDANNITNGNDDTKNVVETRQCLVSTLIIHRRCHHQHTIPTPTIPTIPRAQSVENVFKTRAKTPYRPLWVPTNLWYRNTPTPSTPNLPGIHDFTITSSATRQHTCA